MTRHPWTRWTPEEIARFRALYPDTPNAVIAAQFGRSLATIETRARMYGLHKDPAYLHRVAVQKGKNIHPPRGAASKNWKPVGSEHTAGRDYQRRKIVDATCEVRWVLLHHAVWLAAGREIPPGHRLAFRDGNPRNVALENLECVTCADMIRRNGKYSHGPEIAELVGLKSKIIKTITERENQS
jgi:hypothetical protein